MFCMLLHIHLVRHRQSPPLHQPFRRDAMLASPPNLYENRRSVEGDANIASLPHKPTHFGKEPCRYFGIKNLEVKNCFAVSKPICCSAASFCNAAKKLANIASSPFTTDNT